ncbi:MAG: nitrate reductase [Pseudomonadota bacterium]
MSASVKTTCPYCGVGCGIIATPKPDGFLAIEGDPDHPANFGRLCSKGSALGETVSLDGRLLQPHVHGKPATWDSALREVASRFAKTIEEHGPDSVAFYVSGQLLTEDYYVANKLMKGFIGSGNIDTNSRLCMASSVAGHKRAFGSDTVPGCYEDLEEADLVVLVGSNLAWCHPVIYQRLVAAKKARPQMRVVVVDPRETATCDIADLHLAVAPDGDTALFNGLLAHLVESGLINKDYIETHTNGFDEAVEQAIDSTHDLPEATGLPAQQLAQFYKLFSENERTVTVYSQGVNQSSGGTDKVNAIINCHLATGRIGKPGMGPFSITGQPNAMGGREVGGLANMLAAHMNIEDECHRELVRDFWKAPGVTTKQGLKAVDMFDAVADGRIKAIWIMATNPAVSMPNASHVEAAIAACPFVVVSDVVNETDTVRHAHVKLPSLAWGEKSGTVTNSERRISRQRKVLSAPGLAKADWWQLAQVAQRMGFEGFDYNNAAEIFREHAALSEFQNDGTRDFDIGGVKDISDSAYQSLSPFQWPLRFSEKSQVRMFANGGFFTPDHKARFIAVTVPARRHIEGLLLNTGRIRDHWHTMTRTGLSPRNSSHISEPFCELHPVEALKHGINEADLVRISSLRGSVVVRAHVSARHRAGSVFLPMHWNDQWASHARVDELVEAHCDPVSGQPSLKDGLVTVRQERFSAYGFMVSHERPLTHELDYWALAKCEGGWRLEFALREGSEWAFQRGADTTYQDASTGDLRSLWFQDRALQRMVFLSSSPVAASRSWAAEQLLISHNEPAKRFMLAAGRPPLDQPDKGAVVCSCFGVGANEISQLASNGCSSIAQIGKACGAGTNCGSCQSEISQIISGVIHEELVVAAE